MDYTHRVGIGYDIHPLVEGRRLVLGGVEIPFGRGLAGHSDADVLTHAICDALLGAAAMGDIGTHFPDGDPKYKGVSSLELLQAVVYVVEEWGYSVSNVDAVIVAERPKLAPYLHEIRAQLATVLGIDVGYVSVKAKTSEAMGPEGREEAISAQAVCLLSKPGESA